MIADPLAPPRQGVARRARKTLWVVLGTCAAYAMVVVGFIVATKLAGRFAERERDAIRVAISNRKAPERVPAPLVQEAPKPKPLPKRIAKPPADPIDVPAAPQPPVKAPPVVGIDKNATTDQAAGPGFAVGNTRMGETDTVAHDPAAVAPLSKSVDKPAPAIVVAPLRKRTVEPEYPPQYQELGFEGEVVVNVTIDLTGKPIRVTILQPSPHQEFNRAAERAAMAETFAPATRDGKAIEYELARKYTFRLTE